MKKCSWDLNLRLQGWRMEDRDEWNHWFIATAHEVIYFYCLVWISRLPRSAVLIDSKSGMGNSANPTIGIWPENFASEVLAGTGWCPTKEMAEQLSETGQVFGGGGGSTVRIRAQPIRQFQSDPLSPLARSALSLAGFLGFLGRTYWPAKLGKAPKSLSDGQFSQNLLTWLIWYGGCKLLEKLYFRVAEMWRG